MCDWYLATASLIVMLLPDSVFPTQGKTMRPPSRLSTALRSGPVARSRPRKYRRRSQAQIRAPMLRVRRHAAVPNMPPTVRSPARLRCRLDYRKFGAVCRCISDSRTRCPLSAPTRCTTQYLSIQRTARVPRDVFTIVSAPTEPVRCAPADGVRPFSGRDGFAASAAANAPASPAP